MSMALKSAHDIWAMLDFTPAQDGPPFTIAAGPYRVSVHCPTPLRSALMRYFRPTLCENTDKEAALTVHILPNQSLAEQPCWIDWAREPGKTGRKDAICDLEGGRLIQKVRSGVTFLQSCAPEHPLAVAFGPLDAHESTVINFINTQILTAAINDGFALCHAAAAAGNGRGLAISGLSGGGKSTSILRMMDLEGVDFVSNDRLLVRREGDRTHALGIPKYPRINPGTILGNPRLHGMLSPARRAELIAMPPRDLWDLEDKHDLVIDDIYGPERMQLDASLTDFWVLNWSRDSENPTQITEIDLAARPDLLGAIAKHRGPFYHTSNGHFAANNTAVDTQPVLEALSGASVFEVSGRVDFDVLAMQGREIFAR